MSINEIEGEVRRRRVFVEKRHFFYQLFDSRDYQPISQTFLQNKMTPKIELQDFSSLVYKMLEQFEKVKRDKRREGRTEQDDSNIP